MATPSFHGSAGDLAKTQAGLKTSAAVFSAGYDGAQLVSSIGDLAKQASSGTTASKGSVDGPVYGTLVLPTVTVTSSRNATSQSSGGAWSKFINWILNLF